ncbi:MAG: RNA polymerase sigma factor [Candidatus Acidiferrales bacterium]
MLADPTTTVETVYRDDWGRIVATLIGMVGDFDLAEECAQEAFTAAVEQWPASGIPEFPRAWIIQTARHKAIDRIRRKGRYQEKLESYTVSGFMRTSEEPDYHSDEIPDDRLRLIFTCCHPALALEAQVALTLRTLCGLETDEIARAFLASPTTMAQRLVRAKRKIRDAGIPYVVPETGDVAARLEAVLKTIYLVFNEGYAATRGNSLVRTDLCLEAIRLARLVVALMAPQPPAEAKALLALMLLHDARREARFDQTGELVVLEDQDRSHWNRKQIAEALTLVKEVVQRAPEPKPLKNVRDLKTRKAGPGPIALQAAIAAVHCRAASADDTDWPEIVRLYDLLQEAQPTPVISLNRAVAVAMMEGPQAGLALIEGLAAENDLDNYHLLHAARADLLRRLGKHQQASKSYQQALTLVTNESERRYLERRLREVQMPKET